MSDFGLRNQQANDRRGNAQLTQSKFADAKDIIEKAARDLANIHRAKHFFAWQHESLPEMRETLEEVEPFKPLQDVYVFNADNFAEITRVDFANWVVGKILNKTETASIFQLLQEELTKNIGEYGEITDIMGINIDEECEIEDGIRIIPYPKSLSFEKSPILRQEIRVKPAYFRKTFDLKNDPRAVTSPLLKERQIVRNRVRMAVILACNGPVMLQNTKLSPDNGRLFVSKQKHEARFVEEKWDFGRSDIKAKDVGKIYKNIDSFTDLAILERSIDRLARSRLAASPTDCALDLGMAAEIVLMRDLSSSNTEIAHKISSRAAWLLGENLIEREEIFSQMKALYQARSQAVHSGSLSKKSNTDLNESNSLITRIILKILERGSFPDWTKMILGGVL